MSEMDNPIVIVGGGAGGAELAVRLARAGRRAVMLVDCQDTHVWKPRLHELAAGFGRSHLGEVAFSTLARRWSFDFRQGALTAVDPEQHQIVLSEPDGHERRLDYSVLVLAVGGVTPDFGVPGVADHALCLDDAEDAERIAARLSRASADAVPRVAVVGTGATGVELTALIMEYAAGRAMHRDPPQITLFEAEDRFMPGATHAVREGVRDRLEALGVHIRAGSPVTRVAANTVDLGDGTTCDSDVTIWAVGRIGPPVASTIDTLERTSGRRWRVNTRLQCLGQESIFALGDCAAIEGGELPATAQVASAQSHHLARQIPRYAMGGKPEPYRHWDKGTLLSLGEAGTVGRIHVPSANVPVSGLFAAAAYRALEYEHEAALLGLRHAGFDLAGDALGHLLDQFGPRR